MSYDSTAAGRLEAVRAAINACLTAQQYAVSGNSVQRARLSELRQLEKELIEEAAIEADGGSMVSLGIQTPPSA